MKYVLLFLSINFVFAQEIPLPEHPRPDFERAEWLNLNGSWEFEFDSLDQGINELWMGGAKEFSKEIQVPFPWGSELSGVQNEADIAWYKRKIRIPETWRGKKVFITIGASDWNTSVWVDGHWLGEHNGGYTPFSFELTEHLKYGMQQEVVIRVDDARRMFTLYGKQGYGDARGIWQTVYLDARGETYLEACRFYPSISKKETVVELDVAGDVSKDRVAKVQIGPYTKETELKAGKHKVSLSIPMPDPTLWTLENPYLYDVSIEIGEDKVKSYLGFREISVVNLPNTEIPYIALNGKPVYLQLTLDQSYHPEGFYTFPSDAFMRNEIQLCKDIGLNGLRTHIKVDIPRKLYWADKLGLFVMSDLPNSWGEPDLAMQKESEYTLREMIKRDFNHPSIFSWITFNETWGLRTKRLNQEGKTENKYLPTTQYWVASMYYLAKSLDPTRLVEDNSICCGAGHTETDINSWHAYLPGYEWEDYMANLVKNTYPGSSHDFEDGFTQGKQPMINSECGNVWGYKGSTGDVDWSYDYHRMMNVFRSYPQMAGWLYTEHHDVINEWNGYWKFDRSPKFTGLGSIHPGMTEADFHSLVYVSTGQNVTNKVFPKESTQIPLFISDMHGRASEKNLSLHIRTVGIDSKGNTFSEQHGTKTIPYTGFMQKREKPLEWTAPESPGLYHVLLELQNDAGEVLHRNFCSFHVLGESAMVQELLPTDFSEAKWSLKQWNVLENKKANGAGTGYFRYRFPLDKGKDKPEYFLAEVSAKQLFDKDKEGKELGEINYMLGGKASPHKNSNAYPMTDSYKTPSTLQVHVNGLSHGTIALEDDPADHRGVLSWFYQKEDRTLQEAGSYGYLVKVPISNSMWRAAKKAGYLEVKLSSGDTGGLAVYGKDFGQYPFGPSLVYVK